ncbi:ABC transporter ATP-binding protein [Candidatus Contubernalis alkaliaceticus]|uniref:ABC transporter ATP-binding protein n=1 Tax=Candidatus Contubernalis alkaliaceticus TaxID=338645 RepID=UPI001F4BD642|nr:ABC transporter ATP-binding protein [Candidatus Contubernalis alkalaceticus]UNC93072.1 ABC transporter ATP-binding protein [Candidatus Contubernalis alkalaceticus]
MNSIEVSSLSKNYGTLKAVDNVNLSIKQGDIFGMLGPNGAGKTTTVEILVGLRRPDSGSINILGLNPTTQKEQLHQKIGVQLQTPSLFPRLTVRESLLLNSSFYPDPFPVDQILEWIGLKDKEKSLTHKLSGGQLQRLAVGTAIIGQGDIIFLDEPTTGLDPQARRSLWDVITKLKKLDKTIFLTTHYMEEAQRLCDHVAIIDHGSIIALDSPNNLIKLHFQEQAVELSITDSVDANNYSSIPGVNRVQASTDKITLYSSKVEDTIRHLINQETAGGPALTNLSIRKASLEDVFLKLTGRSIRE